MKKPLLRGTQILEAGNEQTYFQSKRNFSDLCFQDNPLSLCMLRLTAPEVTITPTG